MFAPRFAVFCGVLVFAPVLLMPSLACAEEMAPVALNSFSATPASATSAQVMDQNGHLLGQVDRIQADQDGKPSALSFRAAPGGNTVVISAAAVSYDGHVLIASNDQPQIAALTQPQRTATAQ
jgi:hypothetical protein